MPPKQLQKRLITTSDRSDTLVRNRCLDPSLHRYCTVKAPRLSRASLVQIHRRKTERNHPNPSKKENHPNRHLPRGRNIRRISIAGSILALNRRTTTKTLGIMTAASAAIAGAISHILSDLIANENHNRWGAKNWRLPDEKRDLRILEEGFLF